MKLFYALLALSASIKLAAAAECIEGNFLISEVQGECGYETLLNAFEIFFNDDINQTPGECDGKTATSELHRLLGASDEAQAEAIVKNSICKPAYELYGEYPFADIAGYGESFVQKFYNGKTFWNEEYATLYPANADGDETNLLREDAKQVDVFFEDGAGQHGITQFPDYIPNFATCEDTNSAYCCWPQDRQAGDGNGNCNKEYDVNCIDRNPGDNTDLCYVSLADGEVSTGFEGDGLLRFPLDDGNDEDEAEGPIHCHGFAWSEDDAHISSIFKGNNLFFVSLYDHMETRGYVRNIPGAPMCACASQMPVVSRADCTEIAIDEMITTFSYEGSFTATIIKIDLDFNACQGLDRRGNSDGNDLWSHLNRLFIEGEIDASKLELASQKLVGDDPQMCRQAEKRELETQHGLVRGFDYDSSEWTYLAGRDAMDEGAVYGIEGSTYLMTGGKNTTEDIGIIRRVCADCSEDHQDIYYKRLTPLPEGFDLLDTLLNSRVNNTPGNLIDIDFEIYSTLEDAQSGANPWSCSEYVYTEGFPGDCGPYGTVRNQDSMFTWTETRRDVGFYVTATPGVELTLVESLNIGRNRYDGSASSDGGSGLDEKFYLTSTGSYLWGRRDKFTFMYEQNSGDVNLVAHVSSLQAPNSWTKGGLRISDSLDEDSAHFSFYLTGGNGLSCQWRSETGGWSGATGHEDGKVLESAWLMVEKRINTYTAYTSETGEPGSWEIHCQRDLNLDDSVLYTGMALASGDWNRPAEIVFDNYESELHFFPSGAPSESSAPSSVLSSSMDIGDVSPSMPGVAYESNGEYKIVAAGRDIWDSYDGFHYYAEEKNGDFTSQVYIGSLEKTDNWAKAGLMVRRMQEDDMPYFFVYRTPEYGFCVAYRLAHRGYSTGMCDWDRTYNNGGWARIVKKGTMYTGYKSLDGISWHNMTSMDIPNMEESNGDVFVGMAVTSHNNEAYTTAEFRDFTVEEAAPDPTPAVEVEGGTARRLRGVSNSL